jgi:phage baseplate assembly protein W
VTQFGFPYAVASDGRTAGADLAAHVSALVELVLFTDAGERVNRPDFGSGARQLVFAGNSPEIANALEFLVKGALQRWLGDVLRVEQLVIAADDATLRIDLAYRLIATDERQTLNIARNT